MAKRIVSIPHKFQLAGAISFRKDYSPPSSPSSRPYTAAVSRHVGRRVAPLAWPRRRSAELEGDGGGPAGAGEGGWGAAAGGHGRARPAAEGARRRRDIRPPRAPPPPRSAGSPWRPRSAAMEAAAGACLATGHAGAAPPCRPTREDDAGGAPPRRLLRAGFTLSIN